jgi:hypothetical protein
MSLVRTATGLTPDELFHLAFPKKLRTIGPLLQQALEVEGLSGDEGEALADLDACGGSARDGEALTLTPESADKAGGRSVPGTGRLRGRAPGWPGGRRRRCGEPARP